MASKAVVPTATLPSAEFVVEEASLPNQIELFSVRLVGPALTDSQATPLHVEVITCPSEPCAPPIL